MTTARTPRDPNALLARIDSWLESHARLTCLALYAVALGLRGVHLLGFRDTLLARVLLMDEAYYHAEAWNLIRGVPNPTDSWFMTPLYPYFLSLVFRLVGDGPTGPYAVQLVLGASIAPMIFTLARRAMRASLALVAALGVASFAPIVFFEALLLVEWLVLLALTGALLAAVRAPASRTHAALSGALLGVATLGRGSNLLLVLPLAVWFRGLPGAERGRARQRLGAFLAGCALALAPLFLYNALRASQPLLLTANGGFNLFIGNGPEATGIFALPAGLDLAQDPLALRYVQRETHEQVTASQASRFWLERTWGWVREHPGRTLRLFLWKLMLFWNRFSIPQVESFVSATRDLALSRFPFWHSYTIFPLAGLGAGLGIFELGRARRRGKTPPKRARALALVAICALLYGMSIALFFITDRYRVPVMPLLIVLAAYAGGEVLGALYTGRRKRFLALGVLLLAGLAVTSPEQLRIDRRGVERDLLVHNALRYAKGGWFRHAIREYELALRLAPEDPGVRDGLARMHARAGNDSLAVLQLRDLLRDEPGYARSWYNLGNVYRRIERFEEAVGAYRRALEIEPRREAAWNNLGEAFRAQGDTARAAAAYERALQIVPGYEQALNNLAALRGSQGDAEAAEAGFRAAVAANPRYVPALRNLAILLTNTGRYEEALETWRRILVVDPDNGLASRTIREVEAARGPREGAMGAAAPRVTSLTQVHVDRVRDRERHRAAEVHRLRG
ncbi:MAG: tetratricopeptide repeat protein, partial [Candidatus Krumholzibacteriia bacterium]